MHKNEYSLSIFEGEDADKSLASNPIIFQEIKKK
jgi:hypothetical protein